MFNTPVWKHFAAFVYDIFPLLGVFIATSLIVMLLRGGEIVEPGNIWFSLLLLFELVFYYVYSWKKGGQTLGMRAWKIKIIPQNENQKNLSWKQSLLRFIVGCVSTLCLGLGILWKILSDSKTSWMDMISHSEVKTMKK